MAHGAAVFASDAAEMALVVLQLYTLWLGGVGGCFELHAGPAVIAHVRCVGDDGDEVGVGAVKPTWSMRVRVCACLLAGGCLYGH